MWLPIFCFTLSFTTDVFLWWKLQTSIIFSNQWISTFWSCPTLIFPNVYEIVKHTFTASLNDSSSSCVRGVPPSSLRPAENLVTSWTSPDQTVSGNSNMFFLLLGNVRCSEWVHIFSSPHSARTFILCTTPEPTAGILQLKLNYCQKHQCLFNYCQLWIQPFSLRFCEKWWSMQFYEPLFG